MSALGIEELGKHPTEILLLWRHAEEHAFRAFVPVKSLDIGDGETQFDLSSRVLVLPGGVTSDPYIAVNDDEECSATRGTRPDSGSSVLVVRSVEASSAQWHVRAIPHDGETD